MEPNGSGQSIESEKKPTRPTPKVVTIQPQSVLKNVKKRPPETNQNQNYGNMGPGQGQGQLNLNMSSGPDSPGGNPAMMNGYQPSNMGNYPYQPGMAPSSMEMQAPPIVNQPGQSYMHGGRHLIQNFISDLIPGVPLGLEVLHLTEHLFICPSIGPSESFHNSIKYDVLDTWDRRIFLAVETTGYGERQVSCGSHPFKISVRNFQGHDVLRMEGDPGTGSCDSASVSVYQAGNHFGSALEFPDCCPYEQEFHVKDNGGVTAFTIKLCRRLCLTSTASARYPTLVTAHYNLYEGTFLESNQVAPVGKFTNQWSGSGLAQELCFTTGNYGISFPPGLNVEMKAVLLGAAILIDLKYFGYRHPGGYRHADTEAYDSVVLNGGVLGGSSN